MQPDASPGSLLEKPVGSDARASDAQSTALLELIIDS
jgi:hypothetical protein